MNEIEKAQKGVSEMSQNEELLRAKDVAKTLGIAIPTVWKWAHDGKLPRPLKISHKVTAWKKSELIPFIEGLQRA